MSERLLYVALDEDSRDKNIELAEKLTSEEGNFGFKINFDHAYLLGTEYIDVIQALQRPVFLDLKLHHGKRTMSKPVEDAVERGISHVSVWASAERLIKPLADITRRSDTKLLGVTVTTHYDDDYCQRHFGKDLKDTVRHFAHVALYNGCDGIILPGTTLLVVSELNCIKVVSATRPEWYPNKSANQQRQPVTPAEALEGGASILVCGSPIRKSENPNQALRKILSEMALAS